MPRDSEALALWRLLATGAKLPHGTKHLVCDEALMEHVAVLMRRAGAGNVDFELLRALFVHGPEGPSPVRLAHQLASPSVGWITKEPAIEWRGMLVRWGSKHGRFPGGEMRRREAAGASQDWTGDDESTRAAIARQMGAA